MTMNWGYKLFFTFVVFAGLMSFLVYKALHTDFQLVEKEYYKSELRYQEVIDGTNRVNALSSPVIVSQDEKNIHLQMPAEMKNKNVKGSIWFYCAYDAARDVKLDLKPGDDGIQLVSRSLITQGNYLVKIQWKLGEKNYYNQQEIVVQ
jgi:nitrogen fixation protein FixH